MRSFTTRSLALVALGASSALGWAGSAGAARPAAVACGQVITQSTTLSADVGPCTNNGIVIGADGITLDLNGYTVFGTPAPGDGAGILVSSHTRVTIENGTVTNFDGGVVIQGGTANTVRAITAENNIGSSGGPAPDTAYGDGILLEGSTNNSIQGNVVQNNGPFSGIGLIQRPDSDHPFPSRASTSGNIIVGNQVLGNIACRAGPFCDNDGIRLEPGVGPANVVEGNTVNGNGLDGISLFVDSDHNTIRGNTVDANGFHGAVPGDGIRIFSSANLIQNNSVDGNAAGGVSVGRRPISAPGSLPNNHTTGNPRGKNNRLVANSAGGNGIVDLYDSNPGCDNNLWIDNTFGTANPSCTTG